MQMGVLLRRERPPAQGYHGLGARGGGPDPSDSPNGATLSDQKIALNADFYVSPLAANTEKT